MVQKDKSEWIHARVPDGMRDKVEQLLECGVTKTEIVKKGIRAACKEEGIKAAP